MKKRLRLLTFFLSAVLILGIALPSFSRIEAATGSSKPTKKHPWGGVVTGIDRFSSLAVREKATVNSEDVDKLSDGHCVTIIGAKNNFYKIKYSKTTGIKKNGKLERVVLHGWVSQDYVSVKTKYSIKMTKKVKVYEAMLSMQVSGMTVLMPNKYWIRTVNPGDIYPYYEVGSYPRANAEVLIGSEYGIIGLNDGEVYYGDENKVQGPTMQVRLPEGDRLLLYACRREAETWERVTRNNPIA